MKAHGYVRVRMAPGYAAPDGLVFATSTGVRFESIGVPVRDSFGSDVYTVWVECQSDGCIGNVAAGTITIVVRGESCVLEARNEQPFTNGADEQRSAT